MSIIILNLKPLILLMHENGGFKMIVKQFKHFKHVGKVYCLNIGDSFYAKCGSILKVENKSFDYIFTLSDGKNYTPNQVYSLIK